MRFGLLCWMLVLVPGLASADWRLIAPGMELNEFPIPADASERTGKIIVLRMDPELWDLEFAGLGPAGGTEARTAKDWSKKLGLAAVLNAGMYAEDYSTHIGYMRFRKNVLSKRVNQYQSVAAFHPLKKNLPRFRIFDLDAPGVQMDSILNDYASVVQNLRLIMHPGKNRWSPQTRKWSEAALGEDSSGRILFIFCRTPFSMYDFNNYLLSLKIGLVALQHLEGGPEAQIYIHVDDFEMEMSGTHEAFYREGNEKGFSMPIPNVLGVRPRAR